MLITDCYGFVQEEPIGAYEEALLIPLKRIESTYNRCTRCRIQ